MICLNAYYIANAILLLSEQKERDKSGGEQRWGQNLWNNNNFGFLSKRSGYFFQESQSYITIRIGSSLSFSL